MEYAINAKVKKTRHMYKITIVSVATILVMRLFVFIAANIQTLQFIFYDQSYHFFYGLFLVMLALIVRRVKYSDIFFGVGFGLFVDDVAALKYVLNGPSGNPIADYWSPLFIIPLIVGLFALMRCEDRLVKFFHH